MRGTLRASWSMFVTASHPTSDMGLWGPRRLELVAMNTQRNVKVAVYDPLPSVRAALCRALRAEGFGADESPPDISSWVRQPGQLVVIHSVAEPSGFDGLDDVLSVRELAMVVVLVDDASPDGFASVLRRRAFPVPRNADVNEIVEAVDCALHDVVRIPAKVAGGLADRALYGHGEPLLLVEAELEWMTDLARGQTVTDVAHTAGYSERAMYRRLAAIYRKLGVPNRSLAIARLARAGLIDAV